MKALHILTQARAIGIEIAEPVISRQGWAEVQIVVPAELRQPGVGADASGGPAVYSIEQHGDDWVFSIWGCAPGPCVDDFIARFATREEAISAVLQYAVGGPTLLNGWVVPLHAHPELSLLQVTFAIAQAVTVDADTFARIAWQRREKVFGNRRFGRTRWDWALQYQFLALPHVHEPSATLMLRRDAQEGYLVHR